MAFFPFIESIFYLSLGITFVLIFLIVFHFKSRIETLEKKSFMLTEMYDSLLKEFGVIKSFVFSPQSRQNIVLSTTAPEPSPYKKIVVLDKVEEEEEEDEHESESVYSQSSDSKSSNSESESDEDSPIDLAEEVEVEAEADNLQIEAEELEAEVEADNLEIEVEADNLEAEADNLEIEAEDLETEFKLDEFEHKLEEFENKIEESEHKIETIDLEESVKKSDTNYQKMNVQSLKMLVIRKGLAADPSKMKRAELLKLLEDESI